MNLDFFNIHHFQNSVVFRNEAPKNKFFFLQIFKFSNFEFKRDAFLCQCTKNVICMRLKPVPNTEEPEKPAPRRRLSDLCHRPLSEYHICNRPPSNLLPHFSFLFLLCDGRKSFGHFFVSMFISPVLVRLSLDTSSRKAGAGFLSRHMYPRNLGIYFFPAPKTTTCNSRFPCFKSQFHFKIFRFLFIVSGLMVWCFFLNCVGIHKKIPARSGSAVGASEPLDSRDSRRRRGHSIAWVSFFFAEFDRLRKCRLNWPYFILALFWFLIQFLFFCLCCGSPFFSDNRRIAWILLWRWINWPESDGLFFSKLAGQNFTAKWCSCAHSRNNEYHDYQFYLWICFVFYVYFFYYFFIFFPLRTAQDSKIFLIFIC